MKGSAAQFNRVCEIVDKYGRDPNKLIAILQEVQEEYSYLPEDILAFLSTALGLSTAAILKVIEKELALNAGHRTCDDLLFTLETVACLGACGLAPVVVVNDSVHGMMRPEKTRRRRIERDELMLSACGGSNSKLRNL